MIVLGLASFILFLITYASGVWADRLIKQIFQVTISFNFFETFILGLVASFIYFNLLSFFLPINYATLLPLLLISILVFAKKEIRVDFLTRAFALFNFFFQKRKILFTIPFLCVLFFYWILPPLNEDSAEYHYIAIRWYEQFKIIPGLGNVHGRLAFNPASFIISAAWSFTDLIGQAIYPLNGVLVLLFYAWFFKSLFLQRNLFQQFLLLLAAILSFRITLANISSPSSDLLAGILLLYGGLRTYELVGKQKRDFQDYFPVVIICCFSVTAKLTAIPSLLLIPLIYFIVLKKTKFSIFIKSGFLLALIIIPWLIRNFILSGYFLYPVLGTNLISVDWTVPHNVIQLDYIFSKYAPRTNMVSMSDLQKMNTFQLLKIWFDYNVKTSISSLAITLLAFSSIITWVLFPVFKIKISLRSFLLWGIYYSCAWIWFINSPEHRFGLPYLILAIILPMLSIEKKILKESRLSTFFFLLLTVYLSFHYIIDATKRPKIYYFTLADCWLMPLKDKRYLATSTIPNYIQNFPSVDLGNNIKLYLRTNYYDCLNAPGPCMGWHYGEIEMRGKKIEDGFRNTKDEVEKYYPFVAPTKK